MPPRPTCAARCWPCSRSASSGSRTAPGGPAGSRRGSTWWWPPRWWPGRPTCRFRRSPSRWTWASAHPEPQFAAEAARVAQKLGLRSSSLDRLRDSAERRRPLLLGRLGFQDEDLEAHRRIEGDLAVVGHDPPAHGVLHGLHEPVGHHLLEAEPHASDEIAVAALHEGLLDGGEQ